MPPALMLMLYHYSVVRAASQGTGTVSGYFCCLIGKGVAQRQAEESEQKLHRSSTGASLLLLCHSAHILLTSHDIVKQCKFFATLVHFVRALRFSAEVTWEGT
jgi:hypothetical protein